MLLLNEIRLNLLVTNCIKKNKKHYLQNVFFYFHRQKKEQGFPCSDLISECFLNSYIN